MSLQCMGLSVIHFVVVIQCCSWVHLVSPSMCVSYQIHKFSFKFEDHCFLFFCTLFFYMVIRMQKALALTALGQYLIIPQLFN